MWTLVVFVCLTISLAGGERGRGARQSGHSGPGWDIRLAVPGEPGNDYPTLGNIPRTSFSCAGKDPGYYADLETNCQVFRICTSGSTYGFQSFLCPNGTLFNQAVFVCDWWMNVNCQKSQELFSNNNEKFSNLKLGPQIMKDIKKMITHPMRNPYDKTVMKSNLIVMQDYKPPFSQMFSNGNFIAGQNNPNSIYVPAKQQQQNYYQNSYSTSGNIFAASTPSPQYVPANFNTISPSQRDAEVFQRQRHSGQYVQGNRVQSTTRNGNGHAGQYTQNKNIGSATQPEQSYNQQYNQQANNFKNSQSFSQNAIIGQRGQLNQQNTQLTDNRSPSQPNNGKQSQFGISFTKQFNYNQNQDKQAYTNKFPLPLSNENTGQVSNEAKENLVSNEPATIITKTLTFNRIVEPNPKSRITFKTWIVKPSRSSKLIADPTPYTYGRPRNPPTERLVADTTPYEYNTPTPYVYNTPTTISQTERIVSESDIGPYMYNKPTVAAKQVRSTVRVPSRQYLNPTIPAPTLSGRLYLTPSSAPPTIASRLYLAPTTYKPANLYLPPPQSNDVILSRQYMTPGGIQQPYYQSEQLRASPTSPTAVFATPTNKISNDGSFSLTKQSRINTNHNNLTFADILTKEKLDITVNDIVSDTSKVLNTATPQFEQFRQDNLVDYSDENYLPPNSNDQSDENLTPPSPTVVSSSSRLVEDPSRDLEPPVESYTNTNENTNPLSTLPYYKEPTNTIERTVSLKISIPEKVAEYLFKNNNSADYDKLEILNTGSSNYLVLTNNLLTKHAGVNFIPIGRLISDKNTSISNSQALVFNILADSLNAAKQYSNIAQQNTISPNGQTQFQNVNNEDLSRITNTISQLTASQYSTNQNNNNLNQANVVSSAQTTTNGNQYRAAKYTNNLPQNQAQQAQIPPSPSQQTTQNFYSSRLQTTNDGRNSQTNQNQIYSGQLYQFPVPDVTSQIYNAGSTNLAQSGNLRQQNNEVTSPQRGINQNGNSPNNNRAKQSSAEVEIVQSQTLPLPAAKLQFAPPNEAETFNSHEHSAQALFGNFLNNGNGISAQLQDKIVGTIPHPSEENKFVTYKKDQSYFVYTKLNNNVQTSQSNNQNARLTQSNANNNNLVSFQFVPSVSYQLEDEKDQQKILNDFQIDEYGTPKKVNQVQNRRQDVLTSDVDYSVDHSSGKQLNGHYNNAQNVNTLYAGPSSYSAPQSSVGSLEARKVQNNVNSRLEQFDENSNGYAKVAPAPQFTF